MSDNICPDTDKTTNELLLLDDDALGGDFDDSHESTTEPPTTPEVPTSSVYNNFLEESLGEIRKLALMNVDELVDQVELVADRRKKIDSLTNKLVTYRHTLSELNDIALRIADICATVQHDDPEVLDYISNLFLLLKLLVTLIVTLNVRPEWLEQTSDKEIVVNCTENEVCVDRLENRQITDGETRHEQANTNEYGKQDAFEHIYIISILTDIIDIQHDIWVMVDSSISILKLCRCRKIINESLDNFTNLRDSEIGHETCCGQPTVKENCEQHLSEGNDMTSMFADIMGMQDGDGTKQSTDVCDKCLKCLGDHEPISDRGESNNCATTSDCLKGADNFENQQHTELLN